MDLRVKVDRITGKVRERDDIPFIFTQAVPALTWSINHNLNKRISGVRIYDGSGDEVEGCVVHIDDNNIELQFEVLFSGSAYII
jgi:hypothetical protein